MEKILITGVTGIVGSHVFYELMEEVIYEDRNCELHLLIRAEDDETALSRFQNEVWDIRILPMRLKFVQLENIMENIHIIKGGLTDCTITSELGDEITLFHLAASVNLGNSKSSFSDIYNNNYQATQIFFDKLKNRIKKVNFVSTAFSSGNRLAVIRDDHHISRRFDFRNPYEQYKHKMEAEFGSIDQFRIVADPNGSLNIVPVDYAAKAIVRAAKSNHDQVNITIRENVANRLWIPIIIEKVGVENFEFVSEEPIDPNPIEKMYYKTVGPQINKYLQTSKHLFESQIVRELMADVDEPDVAGMFEELYSYAHSNNFQLAA